MQTIIRNFSIVFSSGCVGGLVKALMVAFLSAAGLFEAFGVKFTPVVDPSRFYQRVISGGVYGFLLLIPLFNRRPFWRGILISLVPSAIEISLLYPFQSKPGMLGQDMGLATPFFMLLVNLFWGLGASYWLKLAREEPTVAKRKTGSGQTLHYRGRTILH